MSNQLATEILIKKREELLDQKNRMTEKINKEISELETALEQLLGKKVWEITKEERYDDENADYIKSSIED